MINIIPAIDIIDGKCVRLNKGDYDRKTVYSSSPADVARDFERMGFRRLHVVDLDGAKSKHIVNTKVLEAITATTNLTVDFGGGLKTDDDVRRAFDCGAAMVTIGSVAVTDRRLFDSWLEKYGPERIILGADVRNGMISINGWKEDSAESLTAFLDYYVGQGVKNVLTTEIARDGTLEGPATALYKEVLAAFPGINLIASGGVGCLDDIRKLNDAGVPEVVVGKAFYEQRIDINELWDWLNA